MTEQRRGARHVTVAICTWNRAGLLRQTLEQLTHLIPPAATTWELIVVNNNSHDDTAEVLRSYEARLPLRPVFEAEPGLSRARNAAVRAARGEYIIWTDDDVLADPGWLAAYCAAFDRWADAAFFGGPIEPWFEGTPPEWLESVIHLPDVRGAHALLNLGWDAILLDGKDVPFGANFAVRLDAQRSQLYDLSLGRRGPLLTSGEETAVLHALIAQGRRGRWVPEARVRHYLPAERQTIAYLRRRFVGAGMTLAYEFDGRRNFLGRPYWVWRQAVESELRYRFGRLAGSPSDWVPHMISASVAWGGLRADRSRRWMSSPPGRAESQPRARKLSKGDIPAKLSG